MLFTGRIAGISGIFGGTVIRRRHTSSHQMTFL
jgi:hypothetical protein